MFGVFGGHDSRDVNLCGRFVDPKAGEHVCLVPDFQECEQDVLGSDVVVAQP